MDGAAAKWFTEIHPLHPRRPRMSRRWRGALEAFVLRLTNIRVCMELLGAFDARKGVG